MRLIQCVTGLTAGLWLPVLASPACAQHYPELVLGGGLTMPHLTMHRSQLPRLFRAVANPALGGTARLLLPVWDRWGIEGQIRLLSLQPGLGYRDKGRYYSSSGSSGLPLLSGLLQTGVGLRRLDLLELGPAWALEGALLASYAWAVPAATDQVGQLGAAGSRQPWATWQQQPQRKGAPQIGAELALRYAFAERHYLLVALSYQYGLLPLAEIRSTQVGYFDSNGQSRTDGRFTVPVRASYAALQFGYGWQLSAAPARATRWHTPRYQMAPDPSDEDGDENGTLP